MEKIYESKPMAGFRITGYHDKTAKTIFGVFVGTFHVESSIEFFRFVMQYVKQHKVKAIYWNLAAMKGTFTKANDFLNKEFSPTLLKEGVRCVAFAINHSDVFLKYAMNVMFKFTGSLFSSYDAKVKAFNSTSEAKTWLEENIQSSIILPE